MRGAILGDIAGSVYEFQNTKDWDFELFPPGSRFTDDTVLSVATAEAILTGEPYAVLYQRFYQLYPEAGYGPRFAQWASAASPDPYGSYANGSAMRISPLSWACETLEQVLAEARRSAECSHDHPEAIAGAQAAALAGFLARQGAGKAEIRREMTARFGYDLSPTLADLRRTHGWSLRCAETLPPALIAFHESHDYESALRNAISLGGDSDTLACICGGIAQAFYGSFPRGWWERAETLLDERLRGTIARFCTRYGC